MRDKQTIITSLESRRLSALEAFSDPMIVLDQHHNIIALNREAIELIRCRSAESCVGANPAQEEHEQEQDLHDWSAKVRPVPVGQCLPWLVEKLQLFEAGELETATFKSTVGSSGGEHSLNITVTRLRGEDGKLDGITIRVHEPRDSDELDATMGSGFESSSSVFLRDGGALGYLALDEEGKVCDINIPWLNMLACQNKEEILGRWFGDFLSADSRRTFIERFPCYKAIGYMNGQELEMLRKDGSSFLALYFGNIVHDTQADRDYIHCIAQDISERKKNEQKLQESEEGFRTAFEYAPIGMALLSTGGRILQVNLSLCRMLGYSVEALIDRSLCSLTHGEDWLAVEKALEDLLAARLYTTRLEGRFIHRDGHIVWVLLNISMVSNDEGTALHFIAQIEDVTERKQAEQKLILLAAACQQTAESIAIISVDGILEFVNPAFEDITGIAQADALGHKWSDMSPGSDSHQTNQEIWQMVRQGESWSGTISSRRKSIEPLELETTISPIKDETGAITHCVVVQRDVTLERKMEAHLRQAQKMEAIGTLAGGIAQDFNNILAAILGYTEMGLMKVGQDSTLRRNLEQIFRAGHRAKDLVRKILAFSRQRIQAMEPLQIGFVIKDVLRTLKTSSPPNIEIKQEIDDKCLVTADPTQVRQLVTNLCTNAIQAMKESGGTLTVTLEEVALNSSALSAYAGLEPGEHVMLSVADTGHGMARDVLHRAFDPFFSTKGSSEGMGMGLAVVHGIVRRQHGAVNVESEPGKGSVFRVLLPKLVKFDPAETSLLHDRLPTGSGSVLVVDDEKELVDTMQEMLEHLGYSVTAVVSGQGALELFRANPDAFDMLITDQSMPTMTGMELGRLARGIRGDLPVILVSSLTDALEPAIAIEIGIEAFLSKPVLLSDLASTARRVLSRREKNGMGQMAR